MKTIDQECALFVSEDGKRFITTYKGSPCFSRSSHDRLLLLKGVDPCAAKNVTAGFWFNGTEQSIKQFLN